VITLDGIAYTLRALTDGQVSDVMNETAERPQPTQAVLRDAIRRYCRDDAHRPDLADALDQEDAAQDEIVTLLSSRPSDLDIEGRRLWDAEHDDQLAALRARMIPLARLVEVATYIATASEAVRRMRRELVEFIQSDRRAMVARGLGIAPDAVLAMPAHHVATLAAALRAMVQPDASAEKNFSPPSTSAAPPKPSATARVPPRAAGSKRAN
jgi:hypothetical protein